MSLSQLRSHIYKNIFFLRQQITEVFDSLHFTGNNENMKISFEIESLRDMNPDIDMQAHFKYHEL